MSGKRLETVKLTAKFKLDGRVDEILPFELYRTIVNELLDYAHSRNITSFKRLRAEKYYELRQKYPKLSSHYIYTACQMACSIYKSFRKLKRRGKAKSEKPQFKREVIMLDDHLFKIDLERWIVKISTPKGRLEFKLLHGKYHEKFKEWKVGQAWLVKRDDGIYLNVVFSKNVEIRECEDVIGVDVNENNITIAANQFIRFETKEKEIRTAYFVKRHKIQKIKCKRARNRVLAKYRKRERNRVLDIYHKVANKIIKIALETNSAIALENLKNIRSKINYSPELNGRLHRWSFRKFQQILEYKAKLNGIPVFYVNPYKTSTLCPICGGKLSPNEKGVKSMVMTRRQLIAYVLGAVLGDGSVCSLPNGRYQIDLKVKDKPFAEEVYSSLKNAGYNPSIHQLGDGRWQVRVYSKDLFQLIRRIKWNKRLLKQLIAGYELDFVRGFYEAEGSLTKSGIGGLKLRITNKDIELLSLIKEILGRHGINFKLTHHGKYLKQDGTISHYYDLYLTKRSEILRFLKLIKPRIKNGHRVLRCKCGLIADRDIIGSWNIRLKTLKMWGVPVPPESPSMKPETGRLSATNVVKVMKVVGSQNGYCCWSVFF